MNILFVYMVKTAVYLTAFFLVYSIMLSKDTSYGRNRAFILLSLASAMIFPLFTLQTIKPMDIQFFGKLLSDVFITANSNSARTIFAGSSEAGLLQLVYLIYVTGVIAFVLKLLIDLLNLLFLIARQKEEGCRIIRFHGFNTSGFSAMGYIFINTRLSQEEEREIIRHEQNHLKQNHFIDIIFIETIKAFQWFNPAIYMFNRSLRAIHEYQADRGCLSSGVPVVSYQSLLLSQVFKSGAFNLTNSFSNPSLIKKRMIMMTKKRTSALANMKLLIVFPVVGLVFLAISACKENISPSPLSPGSSELKEVVKGETGSTPFVTAEEMPVFPGGDGALLNYIAGTTVYPDEAKKNKITGKVIVRFIVEKDCSVSDVTVLQSANPQLDAEAIRVVKTLPKFEKPAKNDGVAVRVFYMLPITFTLK